MELIIIRRLLTEQFGCYCVYYKDFSGPNQHALISMHTELKQAEAMKRVLKNNKRLCSHFASLSVEDA